MENTRLSLWKSRTGYSNIYETSYIYVMDSEENMQKKGILNDYREIELIKDNLVDAILQMQDDQDYGRTKLKKTRKHELYNIAKMYC